MKLTNEVMQALQALTTEIGPQPACAFVADASAHACGGCSGDCKGGGFLD